MDSRYAIFLKRGQHDINIKVGYYTQVLGLGDVPSDTAVESIHSPNGSDNPLGALCNFWRGAENLQANSDTFWAVSQSSPLRRMQIYGNLSLYEMDS